MISDVERIAFVCEALKDKGWSSADKESVQCKHFHGSNNTIFRLSAPGSKPETVALRVCCTSDRSCAEISRDRLAKELFSKHGVGPRQLHLEITDGEDRFIEEWDGTGNPVCRSIDEFVQWGELCARVHKLPTDWYDDYRSKVQESSPILQGLRPDHTVWAFANGDASAFREEGGVPQPPEEIKRHLEDPFWLPRSKAGQRVVTIHGDFHPNNLVQLEGRMKCVDMDFTSVAGAVVDLAYAMAVIDGLWFVQRAWDSKLVGLSVEENFANIGEKKRAFIRAYLHGMGDACDDEAVEELLLDAEVAVVGGLWSPIGLYKKGNNMFGKGTRDPTTAGYMQRFEHMKSLVQLVRDDGPKRQLYRDSILQNGSWQAFVVEKEYVVLLDRNRGDPFYVPLVFETAKEITQGWAPLTLKSHPGRAIILSPETWTDNMEGAEVKATTVVIGPASEGLRACCNTGYVMVDEEDKNRVLTCWGLGCWHGNGPTIVFDREGSTWPESFNWPSGLRLPENQHGQKFEVNDDGTMSLLGLPHFVLGTQTKV